MNLLLGGGDFSEATVLKSSTSLHVSETRLKLYLGLSLRDLGREETLT